MAQAKPHQSPLLIFDIETIPDVKMGRAILPEPPGGWVSDAQVAQAMFDAQLEKTKGSSNFLKHAYHQVAAISVAFRSETQLKIASLGTPESTEAELISLFFETIEKQHPLLVDWNGGTFDLPVLQLRAMKYGICSPTYWDTTGDAQWANYHDRYRGLHLDLMDKLGRYSARPSLDDVATMMGFPGKLGMDGSKVWDAYLAGQIKDIRDYCDHDVINTLLVFFRFEMSRGRLTLEAYNQELDRLREILKNPEKPHFQEFQRAWDLSSAA